MDSQQGPTIQHMELCSVLCSSLDGRAVWRRMGTSVCMTESLRCSLETITTLLIVSVLSLVTQSCLTLCNPLDFSPPSSSVHGDSPGKNTGVGCHALHPGDLPNPGIEPRSPALQADSLPPESPGKPTIYTLIQIFTWTMCLYLF